jgi:type III restriction enzyme
MKDLDIQVLVQSNKIARYGTAIFHLTNIQQLYERPEDIPNPVVEQMGPKPRAETDPQVAWEYLYNSLEVYDDLLVMNDEAHHVHSDDLEWSKTIQKLNNSSVQRHKQGIVMQLDFSATPKDLMTGSFFPHIIYDYPLRQAIIDRKVKRPRIGKLEEVPEPPPTASFVVRNKAQIEVGIRMLKDFQKELSPYGRKPVLFIICDINRNADQVGKFLEDEAGLKGKVLVIHTDSGGNITKKDLPYLRDDAKSIDTNQYDVIVSVMMLKEGWDVRNVVVIVPLRALVSQVLPEQILGRGLRRMEPYNDQWDEYLIVVEHPKFEQLWRAEVAAGELTVDFLPASKARPPIHPISADPTKLEYDIEIPVLEGGIVRRTPDVSQLNTAKLPSRLFKLSEIPTPHILYKEKDLLTSKIMREEILAFDYTDDFDVFLTYITRAITRKAGFSTLFSDLVPKVEDYLLNNAFDVRLDPKDKEQVKKLNDPRIRERVLDVFQKDLMRLSIEQKPVMIVGTLKISESPTLHTSKSEEYLYKPVKSVFTALPADSRFEMEFMRYLDNQDQVTAFVKVVKEMIPMRILYYDQSGFVRYYVPDFVVRTDDGAYILETKGKELDVLPNVRLKDKAAEEWCKNASEMTKTPWSYVKILSNEFQSARHLPFEQLLKSVSYVQASID